LDRNLRVMDALSNSDKYTSGNKLMISSPLSFSDPDVLR